MKKANKKTAAITPIKLVLSFIVLGISAVTTVPTLIDSSPSAQIAAAKGVAVVLASGDVINYK